MRWLLACVFVLLLPAGLTAQEHPRSILVLDDANAKAPFYYLAYARLRAVVNADTESSPINLYTESLDLTRFNGPAYEESLQQVFEAKYREKPIGVIVTIGSGALDYVLRWRPALWPGVPVVFAMVDEPTAARLDLPPDVTGYLMKLRFADVMTVARAVVPDLKTVAFVGDPVENQTIYRHWKDEIPAAIKGLQTIDLSGLPLREVRQRVASLPDHAAILYTGIYSDSEGAVYVPAAALSLITETANSPIVVTSETEIGRGGIGGFVITPGSVGESAARLALRVINGASAASIPVSEGSVVQPIFDWRQMQRWNVSERSLPPGSEIRFRVPAGLEQYRWQISTAAIVILLQSGLILALFYEHRRRRDAEVEARQRMAELAHMNRCATAGEMSASIAHELKQPLTAIHSNAEALEQMLNSTALDLREIKEIAADIRRDDARASEVLRRLRGLVKRSAFEPQDIDLNQTVSEVFAFIAVLANARGVALSCVPAPQPLRVRGDKVQLQQVVLNLIVNGIDALSDEPAGQRRITGRIRQKNGAAAEISISDSGPGIPSHRLGQVFEPFFTTKKEGMGMGLSIARTIVEAHGGRIWAENRVDGGAVFRLRLPLSGDVHPIRAEPLMPEMADAPVQVGS